MNKIPLDIYKYFRSCTLRFGLASAVTVAMWLFRYYKVSRDTYVFLLWNLCLAWIPFVLVQILAFSMMYNSVLLRKRAKRLFLLLRLLRYIRSSRIGAGARFLQQFLFWPVLVLSLFFFLPNSFYIFTDLIHLIANGESWYDNFLQPNALIWFDLIFFLHCSILGLFLGCHTLLVIDCLMVINRFPRLCRILIIYGMLFLSSYGVIIGRFERLNSWDILFAPNALVEKFVSVLLHTSINLQFSIIYTTFLSFAYLYMHANLALLHRRAHRVHRVIQVKRLRILSGKK